VEPDDASVEPDDASVEPDDAWVEPDDASVEPDDASVEPDDASLETGVEVSGPSFRGPAEEVGQSVMVTKRARDRTTKFFAINILKITKR